MNVFYPPRPQGKIFPHQLSIFSTDKWLAQRKFNGTRNLINIKNNKVFFWTRHKTPHSFFKPDKNIINQILSLNLERDKEYWLDSELLLSKTKNDEYKNKIILFDVLCIDKYLFLKPNLEERYRLLKDICGKTSSGKFALVVSNNIWLAENFYSNFLERYKDFLYMDEIEGLVLKEKLSVVDNAGERPYEVTWLKRCRKPSTGYDA